MSEASATDLPSKDNVQPCDFRGTSLLSQRLVRKLRMHEEQFLAATSARVAMFLRAEFPMRLGAIQVVSYRKWAEGWPPPCHLALFKTEPLRGVSILGIPIALASAIVDRLLGGTGKPGEPRELSEIEKALLEQIVQIALEEWCNNWGSLKQLKPALLGSESSGRYLQTAPAETNMLVLTIEARTGDCSGNLQLALPYGSMEPLLRQLCPETDNAPETPAPAAPSPARSVGSFQDVRLPVTAEWAGLELSAREVLHLKAGDVLQLNPHMAREVCVRVGTLHRFNGRLGSAGGRWAVEIANVIKP